MSERETLCVCVCVRERDTGRESSRSHLSLQLPLAEFHRRSGPRLPARATAVPPRAGRAARRAPAPPSGKGTRAPCPRRTAWLLPTRHHGGCADERGTTAPSHTSLVTTASIIHPSHPMQHPSPAAWMLRALQAAGTPVQHHARPAQPPSLHPSPGPSRQTPMPGPCGPSWCSRARHDSDRLGPGPCSPSDSD